jgi:DNA-3-methyladenine glycosylase
VRIGTGYPRAFFERPCLEVAPDLVGAYLVRRLADGSELVGRIVEVEAYLGDGSDPGSHSHRGPTPRNGAMFGPPGRLYVYTSYGIHLCANIVCEPPGSGAAILLRAVQPVQGLERMRALRGLGAANPDRQIASGPGKLTQAFALQKADDGRSVLRGPVRLRRPASGDAPLAVTCTRRIGLTHGATLPYRYLATNNPWVTKTSGAVRSPGRG